MLIFEHNPLAETAVVMVASLLICQLVSIMLRVSRYLFSRKPLDSARV